MTAEASKKQQPDTKETSTITFKCKFCGETKSLSDMIVVTRFFPPIMACRDCERKM